MLLRMGQRHRLAPILPVLSMIDRRRTLHREALAANPAWPAIPMVNVIEQCAVQRRPVGAFARLWDGIERKLAQRAAKTAALPA